MQNQTRHHLALSQYTLNFDILLFYVTQSLTTIGKTEISAKTQFLKIPCLSFVLFWVANSLT